MKTLVLSLFLYFFFLPAYGVHAENDNLSISYPAPMGSYNKVTLENPQPGTNLDCSIASNAGLIFMNTDASGNQNLEICANGNSVAVPSGETCFNRFCSCTSGSCPCSFNGCPAGYTQGSYGGTQDSFSPDGGTHTVYSTVCCGTGSTVIPS